MSERESMEFDVVIVGAGPAGLSAAIRLKEINPDLSVVVLEKGSEVGAHILSGAVVDPSGFDALLPGWREEEGHPFRTPVTAEEATAAAARILPALNTCDGAPNILTVDLDIARGRGTVTALNLHALAPEDPRYAWHACVQGHLERLRFPVSDTAGHTRIRLTLR